MGFKDIYERWERGEASPEERAQVEEELEKYRLLTEHLALEEEPEPISPPEEPPAVYRQAKRALRRRSWWVVGVSVLLACLLILMGVGVWQQWIVPTLEREVFFDPEAETIYPDEMVSDLTIGMDTVIELTCPGLVVGGVQTERTGLGRYDVRIPCWYSWDGEQRALTGTLDRGDFQFEEPLIGQSIHGFRYSAYPFQYVGEPLEKVLAGLEELPDYVQTWTAVSFGRDLSMDELAALRQRWPEVRFVWVGVRAAEYDRQRLPLVGFGWEQSGILIDLNDRYPQFFLEGDDGAALEEHFTSLLRFGADHPELSGLLLSEGYLQERLDYVETNGVYTYGVYVIGAPSELVRMGREEPDICDMSVEELWLSAGS